MKGVTYYIVKLYTERHDAMNQGFELNYALPTFNASAKMHCDTGNKKHNQHDAYWK